MENGKTRYITTPLGQVAIEKELQCIRCSATENFILPDTLTENINDNSLLGCTLINISICVKGWLCAQVVQNGAEYEYTLCPTCVGADLASKRK